jgi:hypothetical protein
MVLPPCVETESYHWLKIKRSGGTVVGRWDPEAQLWDAHGQWTEEQADQLFELGEPLQGALVSDHSHIKLQITGQRA